MDLLAVLKALGDETRFAIYRELAGSTAAARPHGARRPPRPARQHRAPPPRAPAGGRPGRRRGRSTAAPSAGPSTVYSLAPGAPGLGFDPPAHALLAGLLAAAGRARRRRRRRRRRRPAERGASRPGAAPEPAACLEALVGRARPARVRARGRRRRLGDGRRPASRSSTARSGSWPRPTPSWSATCTAGSARASSTPVGGEQSRSSRRCTTATRATSWSRYLIVP